MHVNCLLMCVLCITTTHALDMCYMYEIMSFVKTES